MSGSSLISSQTNIGLVGQMERVGEIGERDITRENRNRNIKNIERIERNIKSRRGLGVSLLTRMKGGINL